MPYRRWSKIGKKDSKGVQHRKCKLCHRSYTQGEYKEHLREYHRK